MKNKLLLFSLFLFVSCEKEYNGPLNFEIDEIPNVFCLLQNDRSYIELKLTQPDYVNGSADTNTIISDASVNIVNNGQVYLLPFDTSSQSYRIDTTLLKVQEGQLYSLDILLANGNKIQSICTIPYYGSVISNISIVTYSTSIFNHYYSYTITLANDDYAEKYYTCKIEKYAVFGTDSFFSLLEFKPFKKPEGVNSLLVNGVGQVDSGTPFELYRAMTYNTTVDVYKYYTSVYENIAGDPMVAPTPLYTNIDGGIGIFGSLISK